MHSGDKVSTMKAKQRRQSNSKLQPNTELGAVGRRPLALAESHGSREDHGDARESLAHEEPGMELWQHGGSAHGVVDAEGWKLNRCDGMQIGAHMPTYFGLGPWPQGPSAAAQFDP
jgi:hypothetical protein